MDARPDRRARAARDGIVLSDLGLITLHVELEQVMCSGPRHGNQFTYALLAHRSVRPKRLSRDEALGELTKRFFSSHGPATLRDFAWWSGLTIADGTRGMEINRGTSSVVDGVTYWTVGRRAKVSPIFRPTSFLLPIYDEYMVAYRDRKAVPRASSTVASKGGVAVIFQHAVVINGQIAGTWRTARKNDGVIVTVVPTRKLTRQEQGALRAEAARYGQFLDAPVSLSLP